MLYSAVGSSIYFSGQDKKISEGGQEEKSSPRYVSSSTQRTLSTACFIGVIQQKKASVGQMIDVGGGGWGGWQGWGKGMSQQPNGEKE